MYSTIDYVCKVHREIRKQDVVSYDVAESLYYALKEALKELLDTYCQKFGFDYSYMDMNISGRKVYGRCSSAHCISFNPAIINYSPEFIRHVVIHELCHTRHPSHRYCFWKLVESCLIEDGLIPPGDYVKREQFVRKADNPAINFPIKSEGKQMPYFEKRTTEMFQKVRKKDKIKLVYEPDSIEEGNR